MTIVATPSRSVMQVQDVTHAYGRVTALSEVSFTLGRGVTALLGVNGAGKSTLLSCAAGILEPTSGSVAVGGRDLYARATRREALPLVALMPQGASFPGRLTPREVVSYLAWLKGLPTRKAQSRADECLAAVGLADVAARRLSTLSGGMVRRVAFAQALASEPKVLLLDEPTTGLDPAQRRAMVELIRGLDCTVLLSSHVVEDVADLAGDVLVIHAGRLRFSGTVADLADLAPAGSRRSAIESGFFRVIEEPVPA